MKVGDIFKEQYEDTLYTVHKVTDEIIEVTCSGELVQYNIEEFNLFIKPFIIIMGTSEYIKLANKHKVETLIEHPDLINDIDGLYDLMLSEIEEGNSASAEYDNFISAVNDLIEEQNT